MVDYGGSVALILSPVHSLDAVLDVYLLVNYTACVYSFNSGRQCLIIDYRNMNVVLWPAEYRSLITSVK